jgi:hypothetical protein
LAHRVHVELHEYLTSKEAAHAFADETQERDIRRKLIFERKNTLGKAHIQALELITAEIAAGTPSKVTQTTARTFWRIQYSPTKRTSDSLRTGAAGTPTICERTAPTYQIKKATDAGKTGGRWQEETAEAAGM